MKHTDKPTQTASAPETRIQWQAERLNSGRYIVRPIGSVGNCGSWPKLWTARIVTKSKVNRTLSELNKGE